LFRKGELNMASRKFRFVSPGVFLKEVDNSQLPAVAQQDGPIIIGRTRKGPALRPYQVQSPEELERVFGKPMPGNQGEDPWRDGTHLLAEAYATFAAKAHLASETGSPVTIVRLAGVAGDDARAIDAAEPGWKAKNAWGLFLADDSKSKSESFLAAIFYGADADFVVKAKGADASGATATVTGSFVKFSETDELTLVLQKAAASKDVKFSFPGIRKEFSTNPVATNTEISTITSGTLSELYWLGETFDEAYKEFAANLNSSGNKVAMTLKLGSLMGDFKSATTHQVKPSRSGWVFGQDTSKEGDKYSPDKQEKLFRFISIPEGSESNKLMIGIEDIKPAREGAVNKYGTFSVVVKQVGYTGVQEIERFDDCNLNPDSSNFIAKMIGDQYLEWDPSEKRNKLYGSNPNISEFIRVEMQENVANSGPRDPSHIPFGFYGPIVPKAITATAAGQNATAKITVNASDSFPFMDGGSNIVLTDGEGTTMTMALNNAVAVSANGVIAGDGAGTPAAFARRVAEAINATPGKITASPVDGSSNIITLTQDIGGAEGNTNITTTNTDPTLSVDSKFAGGVDGPANSASRWVGQRFNPTGSYTATTPPTDPAFSLKWPRPPLITKTTVDKDFRFGATAYALSYQSGSIASVSDQMSPGYCDTVRRLSTQTNLVGAQESGIANDTDTEYSYKFSLDEVVLIPVGPSPTGSITSRSDVRAAYWLSGSRPFALKSLMAGNTDTPDVSGSNDNSMTGSAYRSFTRLVDMSASVSLRTLTDIVGGFDMPMVGGFDGVDIVEANPFNNRVLRDGTTASNYAFASVDRALELIRDPEYVEHNLAIMPGITNESLTTKLVDTCESRADSLAIIDLPNIYVPPSEDKCTSFKDRVDGTTPERTAAALVKRQINSSYGATYYPWVKIKDVDSNRDVWVPPSVVALGVMAYTEKQKQVWFAPAGFNRGGLDQGTSGLPVLQVSEQLLSKDRDTLYQANINPIASFVSEGIVIFGQKTLQQTQSALDRINVRRLLIFIKKIVARISNNLLFEQNVRATWLRFLNQVEPKLDAIKSQFGLTDYKVVLDKSTTTPDLVDRNILYAKIFLKPARSIEFIAVDFVITRTGASFDD